MQLREWWRGGYEPDAEFIDGVLVPRNAGSQEHGCLQAIVGGWLHQRRLLYGITTFIAARLRVNRHRYRIPDVCALEIPYTKSLALVEVPAIVVEINSTEDTFDTVIEKCFDYEELGVPEHPRDGSGP